MCPARFANLNSGDFMKLIECKKLCAGYDNKIILNNLSFSITNGSFVYIIGENGTGKSTLIKCLLKIKNAKSGEVCYCEELKQNEIGYMPQQNEISCDFPASVFEIALSGTLNKLGFRPFYTQKQKKKALHMLELLDIKGIKDCSFQELSGGQKQRVLLARSLCASSKVLLLDEPTNNLDAVSSKDLIKTIKHLNEDYKITVITVSHDISSAIRNATHILHLKKDGYFYGTKDEFIKTPEFSLLFSEES